MRGGPKCAAVDLGVFCLRHSFVVHLLREGALRTIDELLNHRTAEATCAYLPNGGR